LILLVGCAQPPAVEPKPPEKAAALPPLPATYVNDAGCPGCLAVTLTLRPDGSYLVRDKLGASEFYDFGRWRFADGTLDLSGGRDARRYPLHSLRRAGQVEMLRGPFRLIGHYDGATFKECRTGLAWGLADTRAAKVLKDEFMNRQSAQALVALDAQFDGSPEVLRVLRPATLLDARSCPG